MNTQNQSPTNSKEDAPSLYESACTEFYNKEYSAAIDSFKKVIRLGYNIREARFHRDIAIAHVEGIEKHVAMLDNAIKNCPTYADNYALRGYLQFELGKDEEGLNDLLKALKIDKDFDLIRNALSEIYSDIAEELKEPLKEEIIKLQEKYTKPVFWNALYNLLPDFLPEGVSASNDYNKSFMTFSKIIEDTTLLLTLKKSGQPQKKVHCMILSVNEDLDQTTITEIENLIKEKGIDVYNIPFNSTTH